MKLTGTVTSGLGEAWFWVKKIEDIFKEKTGIDLFHGTLNIELGEPYKLGEDVILIHKEEYGGTEEVLIKPCKIQDYPAYAVRTAKNESGEGDHPLTVLEIVSDIKLREKFGLKDGDKVLISE